MNENGIVVLSLFDGMSGAQIALNRLGVKIDKYYASEIDKYAAAVTQYNYPDTIQLGDVTKWRDWDIDWGSVDVVVGGFPCQAWSMAGKQMGDRDERGKLFWTMLDIISRASEENRNAVFLMENVKMKKEFEEYITQHAEMTLEKVNKYLIDSSLVSAQSRKRFYWTNIDGVERPDDKGIYLADIIEHGIVDSEKSYCIDANYFKGGNLEQYFEKHRRQLVFTDLGGGILNRLNTSDDIVKKRSQINGDKAIPLLARMYANWRGNYLFADTKFRMLTPVECERLQTADDNYTALGNFNGEVRQISKTQRYKMLGNGFTVDVIAHILSHIPQIKSGEWL